MQISKAFRDLLLSLGLLSAAVLLGACSTLEGAGKDIEKAGEAIQEEASED